VEIENWLVGLSLANGTKNDILYALNIVLREAKREKLISHNPIDEVDPLAASYKGREVFTLEELKKLFPNDSRQKLLETWNELKYASPFHTIATTGIRSGEARALQWQDVSWDLKGLLVMRAPHCWYRKKSEMKKLIRFSELPESLSSVFDQHLFDLKQPSKIAAESKSSRTIGKCDSPQSAALVIPA
jgi:integrase